MKIFCILIVTVLTGCSNITGTYTICTKENNEWSCITPLTKPVLDITFHEKQDKITCIRRPKLDRMIMNEWKCPGVKEGLPVDFPKGYFPSDKRLK